MSITIVYELNKFKFLDSSNNFSNLNFNLITPCVKMCFKMQVYFIVFRNLLLNIYY